MVRSKKFIAACLSFAAVLPIILPLAAVGQAPPPAGRNNLWYYYSDSDTVFIFVHGILSDSRTCWLNTTSKKQAYWPALVRSDASRFGNVAIYLGGYYTAIDSGPYKIQNAARELFDGLREVDTAGRPPAMTKKNLVFIGHSTGGIVIRYMLDAHRPEFADKTIGLVLVASPSIGSKQADRLAWLTEYFNNELGLQLKWNSELLSDLDDRFSMLIAEKSLPYLAGIEACENHFVVHRRFLPDSEYVVSPESGARYFRPCKMLPSTDHFSTVKPDSKDHVSHRMLWSFYSTKFKNLIETRNRTAALVPDQAAFTTKYLSDIKEIPAEMTTLIHGGLQKDRVYWQPEVWMGNSRFYKALGIHPEAGVTVGVSYQVPAGANWFKGLVGNARQDSHLECRGSFVFRVLLNNATVASDRIQGSWQVPPLNVTVPVAAGQVLTLEVTDGGDGNWCDHMAWGDPRFEK
jgi:pimeloyl-ACP methyl ester carboxylesterase